MAYHELFAHQVELISKCGTKAFDNFFGKLTPHQPTNVVGLNKFIKFGQ